MDVTTITVIIIMLYHAFGTNLNLWWKYIFVNSSDPFQPIMKGREEEEEERDLRQGRRETNNHDYTCMINLQDVMCHCQLATMHDPAPPHSFPMIL